MKLLGEFFLVHPWLATMWIAFFGLIAGLPPLAAGYLAALEKIK